MKTEGTALPEAFLARMKLLLKEEYGDFLASYEDSRVQGLRINKCKLSAEEFLRLQSFGICAEDSIPWADGGYYYAAGKKPGKHPWHEAGLYYIQEPSAMAAAALLAPKPGEYVLDLCAAPGGKSTHLASEMKDRGFLLSNEIQPARAKILSQNVERMGLANTVVTNEAPEKLAGYFKGYFDCILVDAPCSGEGMFRKDENARREWTAEAPGICAQRQKGILSEAVTMLKKGGRLLYSTCTFSEEENEGVVDWFIKKYPFFRLEKSERLWPHKIKGEGHFTALLISGEEPEKSGPVSARTDRQKMPAEYASFLEETGLCIAETNFIRFGEQLYLLPAAMPAKIKGLRVLRPGRHLGTLKRNRFEPSHALALSLKQEEKGGIQTVSVSLERAHAYLRGEALRLTEEEPSMKKGWCLIELDGYVVGWGKINNGVVKNHYPKGLRRHS